MMVFYSLLGISILLFVLLAHKPLFFVIIVFIAALPGGVAFCPVSGNHRGLRRFHICNDQLWHHLHGRSMGGFDLRMAERIPRYAIRVI
jgi:hypothetical protein